MPAWGVAPDWYETGLWPYNPDIPHSRLFASIRGFQSASFWHLRIILSPWPRLFPPDAEEIGGGADIELALRDGHGGLQSPLAQWIF